jgi:hypothetical protein
LQKNVLYYALPPGQAIPDTLDVMQQVRALGMHLAIVLFKQLTSCDIHFSDHSFCILTQY